MPQAAINAQEIYFEDTDGDGVPVVLAHGFLMDHEMFAPQVAALRPHAPEAVNAAISDFLAAYRTELAAGVVAPPIVAAMACCSIFTDASGT